MFSFYFTVIKRNMSVEYNIFLHQLFFRETKNILSSIYG